MLRPGTGFVYCRMNNNKGISLIGTPLFWLVGILLYYTLYSFFYSFPFCFNCPLCFFGFFLCFERTFPFPDFPFISTALLNRHILSTLAITNIQNSQNIGKIYNVFNPDRYFYGYFLPFLFGLYCYL